MFTSDDTSNIAKSLVEFQRKVPAIPKKRTAKVPTKSGGEYSYKYADLSDILAAISEPLAAQGLAVSQSAFNGEGGVGVTTVLLHTSGEHIQSDPLVMPLQGATAQAIGSAITYARRYALCSILGISAEEDDDGKLATDHGKTTPPAQTAPQTTPQTTAPPAQPQTSGYSQSPEGLTAPTRRLLYKMMEQKGIIGPYADKTTPEGKKRLDIARSFIQTHLGKGSITTEAEGLQIIDTLAAFDDMTPETMFGGTEVEA